MMALARQEDSHPAGFDFTGHMRALCGDMVDRLPELRHIKLDRVAIAFCQTRKAVRHGMHASLTPMRFDGGRLHTIRRGRQWGVQRMYDQSGRELLYILSFYLPRFLNLAFREKLTTVVHELWHIGPRCDGDLRRFEGRFYAHGTSRGAYDTEVERLVDRWLALDPLPSVHAFLRHDHPTLVARHGAVFGVRIPVPKLIPLDGRGTRPT